MLNTRSIELLIILTYKVGLAYVKCYITLNPTKKKRRDNATSIIGQVKSFRLLSRSRIHVYMMHEGAMSSIDRRCILRPLSDAATVPYFYPTRNTRPPDNVCRSRKVMEGNSAGWSTTSCEIGGRFNKHRVVPLVILSRISRGMHRAQHKEVSLRERR